MVTRGVVAVMSVAVLCLGGCTREPLDTPTPTTSAPTPPATSAPAATPTPTPTGAAWSKEQRAAVDAVEKWYLIYNEAMRGERGAGDFVLAGRGDLVNETGRTYNQLALAELTVKGEILISDLTPGRLTEKMRRLVRVALCQDMTGWQVLDKDGKDTLSVDSKVVRPLVATVEEWPKDGWYVTSISAGGQPCGASGS